MKIILFELNEVPYRVLDDFVSKNKNSFLGKNLNKFSQYTTIAPDIGELSPWKTWPSLHRGVGNKDHEIHDFNESLDEVNKKYPPIWSILKSHKIKTGVFGSFHTSSIPKDVEEYSFYVPDAFSDKAIAIPETIESFQEFNLSMSRASARNVSSKIHIKTLIKFLKTAPFLGIKFKTISHIILHLFKEQLTPWVKTRRRTFQSVIAFDIFMDLLKKNPTEFSTFFTNHVASSMHRYWSAAYPEDYEIKNSDKKWQETYRNEIQFAMSWTDYFLERLFKFVEETPGYTLLVASSMGQAATQSNLIETQLYPKNTDKFMRFIGLEKTDYMILPGMFPQFNVKITSDTFEEIEKTLKNIKINDLPLIYRFKDGFLSMDFGHENLKTTDFFYCDKPMAFELAGLENMTIEDKAGSSAYHIPEGILMSYSSSMKPLDTTRKKISTLEVVPAILEAFGLSSLDYMTKNNSLRFT